MKKILIGLFVLAVISISFSGGGPKKEKFGVYAWMDTAYFMNVTRTTGTGGFLVFDTLTSSPTFGKLLWVRQGAISDLARVAVALTTTGVSGVSAYNNTTGIFNVPNYGGQTRSKGVFVASPTSTDTIDVWQTPVAITITSLKAILRGTSPSVTYNIGFGTNIQSPTAVFTSNITCTSVTTE